MRVQAALEEEVVGKQRADELGLRVTDGSARFTENLDGGFVVGNLETHLDGGSVHHRCRVYSHGYGARLVGHDAECNADVLVGRDNLPHLPDQTGMGGTHQRFLQVFQIDDVGAAPVGFQRLGFVLSADQQHHAGPFEVQVAAGLAVAVEPGGVGATTDDFGQWRGGRCDGTRQQWFQFPP